MSSSEGEYDSDSHHAGLGLKRKRQRHNKERDLYGVFYDDVYGDGEGAGGEMGKGKGRYSKGGKGRSNDKPIGFVSSGTMHKTPEKAAVRGNDDEKPPRSQPGTSFSGGMGQTGLGYGGGGLGYAADPNMSDSVQQSMQADLGGLGGLGLGMPSSFGQKILSGAEKRRKTQAQTQRKPPSSSQQSSTDIGSFEKHTKGIGLKLLQRMGYELGKGLGRDKQGIAAPVEAQVRPKGMALGFGDFQEQPKKKEMLSSNKSTSAKAASSSSRPMPPAAKNLWKKTKKVAREKIQYKTAEEMLVENASKAPSQTIIDMRGPQSKVLTKLERINEVPMDALAETIPMPELQYNMRLVVDLAESELQKVDHEVRQEKEINDTLKEKVLRLEFSQKKQKERLERLQAMASSLHGIKGRSLKELQDVQSTLADLRALKQKYPEEFMAYNAAAVGLSVIYEVLDTHTKTWKPSEECRSLLSVFEDAKSVLQSEGSNMNLYENDDIQSDPYSLFLKETLCFQLHRFVRNEWNPLDPDPIMVFFDQWTKVLTNAVKAYVVRQMIFPKLRDAVNDWEPKTGSIPIHIWIHPWLPLLDEQLEELYPQIRQKLVLALKSWQPSDPSAFSLLKPWKPVFDLKSWEKMTSSSIVPKLKHALATMMVDPKKHDTSVVKWVVQWSEYIPSHTICRLLSEQFFPKLHKALYLWLGEGDLNFEDVAEWYENWKSVFPEELEAQEVIRIHFNKCLLMMNAAVSGEDLSQYDPEKDTEGYARKNGTLPERKASQKTGFDASLKDLVENFSVESGIEFTPKVGRFHNSLQVYSFGGISITLDNRNQVIEALMEGKWSTVSLERLLAEHSKRHSAS